MPDTDEFPPANHLTLSDAWRDWVVENLEKDAPADVLIDSLISWGAPEIVARHEVGRLADPLVLQVLRRERQRTRRAEQILRLRREHLESAPPTPQVSRQPWPDPTTFFREYYAQNRPAVFTDVVERWGIAHWTVESLAARFSNVEVTVCQNRNSDHTPDKHFAQHASKRPFGEFVADVLAAGRTNDLYLIANNHALRDSPLRRLLDEVTPDPEVFAPDKMAGASSLWVGPAGTVTPLHHDVSNILFGQIQGRKRVVLIAPHYVERFEWDGFYAHPSRPPFDDVPTVEAILSPGDALLIPAGWLHYVEALEPSLNLSLLCFRRPNAFAWFRPGPARA